MEKSLNRVELRGRIGQDARILRTDNGRMVARFTVATNELVKNRDETYREDVTWHNIVAWERKGMPDFQRLRKGTFIELEGKIKYSKFTAATGEDRYVTEIVAQKIIIPVIE